MNNDDLSAIRARCAEATPGPYRVAIGGYLITAQYDPRYPEGQCKIIVADTMSFNNPSFIKIAERNAVFFANARTDIPALLEHIGELRAENERLKEALSEAARKAVEES